MQDQQEQKKKEHSHPHSEQQTISEDITKLPKHKACMQRHTTPKVIYDYIQLLFQ